MEESAGYVTSLCNKETRLCDVPNKFPWGPSESNPADPCVKNLSQTIIYEHARLNDGKENEFTDPIPNYVLQGYSATNMVQFTNPAYGREKNVEMKTFAIMQSND